MGLKPADLFCDGKQKARPPRKVKDVYDYTDEADKVLYQKVRYEPKDFIFRVPTKKGAYLYKLNGTRRIPYHLKTLIAAQHDDWVFICEGEKDVHSAESVGLVATTAGSADTWPGEINEHFQGRRVALLPDNDSGGDKHVKRVTEALEGIAKDLRVVRLPGLQNGGDVTDWLEAHDSMEPEELRQRLLAMVDAAIPVCTAKGGDLKIVDASKVEEREVDWSWENKVPRGMLTLLGGDGGVGKTFATHDLAARITRGWAFPEDPREREPKRVVIVGYEDDFNCTVVPRLRQCGADLSRVSLIPHKVTFDEHGNEREIAISISGDIDQFDDLLGSNPDIDLVVFDPVTEFMQRDTNSADEVRESLSILARLARKHNTAIVGITHFNKKSDLRAVYRLMGSQSFVNVCRVVLLITFDPEDEEPDLAKRRRLLSVAKANICTSVTTLAFHIHEGKVVYEDGTVDMDADSATSGVRKITNKTDRAAEWLQAALRHQGMARDDVFEKGKDEGYSQATLYRAAKTIGVITDRGYGGPAVWRLSAKG